MLGILSLRTVESHIQCIDNEFNNTEYRDVYDIVSIRTHKTTYTKPDIDILELIPTLRTFGKDYDRI